MSAARSYAAPVAARLDPAPDRVPEVMRTVSSRRIKICGFVVWDFSHRAAEFHLEVGWLTDGSLRALEHRVGRMENAPAALMDRPAGCDIVKAPVRVSPDAPGWDEVPRKRFRGGSWPIHGGHKRKARAGLPGRNKAFRGWFSHGTDPMGLRHEHSREDVIDDASDAAGTVRVPHARRR